MKDRGTHHSWVESSGEKVLGAEDSAHNQKGCGGFRGRGCCWKQRFFMGTRSGVRNTRSYRPEAQKTLWACKSCLAPGSWPADQLRLPPPVPSGSAVREQAQEEDLLFSTHLQICTAWGYKWLAGKERGRRTGQQILDAVEAALGTLMRHLWRVGLSMLKFPFMGCWSELEKSLPNSHTPVTIIFVRRIPCLSLSLSAFIVYQKS